MKVEVSQYKGIRQIVISRGVTAEFMEYSELIEIFTYEYPAPASAGTNGMEALAS